MLGRFLNREFAMSLTLFSYYRSSASYRIRIVLNLKNLPWNYATVMLNRGEQKQAEFLARNPSGLVPVLDTGPASLSQSIAIAEYLEEVYPEPGPATSRSAAAGARPRNHGSYQLRRASAAKPARAESPARRTAGRVSSRSAPGFIAG